MNSISTSIFLLSLIHGALADISNICTDAGVQSPRCCLVLKNCLFNTAHRSAKCIEHFETCSLLINAKKNEVKTANLDSTLTTIKTRLEAVIGESFFNKDNYVQSAMYPYSKNIEDDIGWKLHRRLARLILYNYLFDGRREFIINKSTFGHI